MKGEEKRREKRGCDIGFGGGEERGGEEME